MVIFHDLCWSNVWKITVIRDSLALIPSSSHSLPAEREWKNPRKCSSRLYFFFSSQLCLLISYPPLPSSCSRWRWNIKEKKGKITSRWLLIFLISPRCVGIVGWDLEWVTRWIEIYSTLIKRHWDNATVWVPRKHMNGVVKNECDCFRKQPKTHTDGKFKEVGSFDHTKKNGWGDREKTWIVKKNSKRFFLH